MRPDEDDETYQDDDQQSDEQTQDDDQSSDDDQPEAQDAHQAMTNAAPGEVDAHRDMLSQVFQTLEGQGVNTAAIASQAGANTTDPGEMSHGDLISTTLALARQHPEVMQMVAQRFPQAQGLLGSVLGGGESAGGGGLLSGLLGRL